MPETALYEARYAGLSALFNEDRKVYTEDVGSSSLSSPTIYPNGLADFYEVRPRFT